MTSSVPTCARHAAVGFHRRRTASGALPSPLSASISVIAGDGPVLGEFIDLWEPRTCGFSRPRHRAACLFVDYDRRDPAALDGKLRPCLRCPAVSKDIVREYQQMRSRVELELVH